MFLIYDLNLMGLWFGWYFIVFLVCSIFLYFKWCVCFIIKLCGCGKGEEDVYEENLCIKVIKCIGCLIGLLVLVVFLFFIILLFFICCDGKSCVFYMVFLLLWEIEILWWKKKVFFLVGLIDILKVMDRKVFLYFWC